MRDKVTRGKALTRLGSGADYARWHAPGNQSEDAPNPRGCGGVTPRMATRHRTQMHAQRALTLVELLIAVSIISVLAGIIVAAGGHAKSKARQAACASNLRQIGLALQMYALDHDGVPPPWTTRWLGPSDPPKDKSIKALARYGASSPVWFCPSDPDAGKPGVCKDEVQHWLTSYEYGGWGWSPYRKEEPPDIIEINEPAKRMMWALVWDARWVDWGKQGPMAAMYRGKGSWHSGGFNILYIDGKVRWMPLVKSNNRWPTPPNPFKSKDR